MYIKRWIRSTIKFVVYILILFWILWLFSSCKTRYIVQEVPVEIHDTIKKVTIQARVDTLWKNDSISIIDTMWIDTSTIATLGMPTLHHNRTTTAYSDRGKVSTQESVDTTLHAKETPIIINHTEYKEIEKPLKKWQVFLMCMGAAFIVGVGAFVALKVKKILHK